MRVGLLFGSFNPLHVGHLIVAEHMATHTDLAEVWFVVSPQSPYKTSDSLLAEQARLALVEAAIATNPRLKACDVELTLPKPSYTIATLDELRRRFPAHEFVLLMGSDNLAGLTGWKAYERIRQEVGIYVYPRPGFPVVPAPDTFRELRIVEAPLLDISATYIRQCISAGLSIRYLVSTEVEHLIRTEGYWQ